MVTTVSKSAIVVQNLSKSYLLGHRSGPKGKYRYTTLRDVIGREVRNFARNAVSLVKGSQIVQGDEIEEFWALKNVSFEVAEGEVIGIIGRNGAGKSTLLKILSRITEPTAGRVTVRGRVASLLEVGTGFHSELSGRENIYLNGAILGMRRAEIRRKFDEIVAFAELEKFLDTPVKHYSSGMYVRLAFAVAAHLEPDVLVIDEVLAVGDAEFQKKCLGKMDEVSRREGRTILFVSHNLSILRSICPSAIWLDHGSIRQQGAAADVIGDYSLHGVSSQDRLVKLDELPRRYAEGDRVRLERIEWLCDLPLRHGERVKARIYLRTRSPIADISVGIGFSNLGRRLLSYDSDLQPGARPRLPRPGAYSIDFEVSSLPLAPDLYNLDIICRSGGPHMLDYVPESDSIGGHCRPNNPWVRHRWAGGCALCR